MKKFILGIALLLIPINSLAEECSFTEALIYQWGHVADTAGNSITAWRHQTEPKPSQALIDAATVSCNKAKAKSAKKEEIKAEASRRAKLIDEDFSLNNIGIYKKISVAALDADGVSIRSVLIYAKQKMNWVDTASTQDINSYDPTTDVGWP
jgi:hypothetical protein